MSFIRVRKMLETRLKTWADTQSLPVAWENHPYDPPDTMYLKAFILPNHTGSQDLLGDHRLYSGVFQVTVVGQRDTGPNAAEAVAALLDAEYPVNLTLTDSGTVLRIISPMSIGPADQSERYALPVSCSYRCDTI